MAGGTKPSSADVDAATAPTSAGVHRFDLLNSLLKNELAWLGALAGEDTLQPGDLAAGTPNSLLGYGGTGTGSVVTLGTGLLLSGGVLTAPGGGGGGGGVPTSRLVATTGSLLGGGALSADLSLRLSGDVTTPGALQLYGTNNTGVRGWYPQPSGGPGGASWLDSWTGSGSGAAPATTQVLLEDVHVDVVRFGADRSASADSTAALQAADAYAALIGAGVFLPAGRYLVTAGVTAAAGRWRGDGAVLVWRPGSVADLTACVTVAGGAGTLVSGVGVEGPTVYDTPHLTTWVTWGSLPSYTALAGGVAGFATAAGAGTVRFVDCAVDRCKVGFRLSSTTGGASLESCRALGGNLVGVYAAPATRRHTAIGGDFRGALASVLFGDTLTAAGYGGLDVAFFGADVGRSPYVILQLSDNLSDTSGADSTNGAVASFFGCSLPVVGEACVKTLTNSLSSLTFVDCFGAWAPGADPLRLPMNVGPVAAQQPAWLALGRVAKLKVVGFRSPAGAGFPAQPARDDGASVSADFTRLEHAIDGETWASMLGRQVVLAVGQDLRADGACFGDPQPASKADFARRRELSSRGNLLVDPEGHGGALGTTDNASTDGGGPWVKISGGGDTPTITVNTLPGWGPFLTGISVPGQMYQECGSTPTVIMLQQAVNGSGFFATIPFAAAPFTTRRIVAFSLWFTGNVCVPRLLGGGGVELYTEGREPGLLTWRRAIAVGKRIGDVPGSDGTYLSFGVGLPAWGEGWLAFTPPMVTLDDVEGYSRYPGPALTAPLYHASGGMAAPPLDTAGAGVPTLAAANGSTYRRTDGAGTTDNLYIRRGGAWVGIA